MNSSFTIELRMWRHKFQHVLLTLESSIKITCTEFVDWLKNVEYSMNMTLFSCLKLYKRVIYFRYVTSKVSVNMIIKILSNYLNVVLNCNLIVKVMYELWSHIPIHFEIITESNSIFYDCIVSNWLIVTIIIRSMIYWNIFTNKLL